MTSSAREPYPRGQEPPACPTCGGAAHVGRVCPEEFFDEDTVRIEPGDPLYPALGHEVAR